jgi:hypothetical protein
MPAITVCFLITTFLFAYGNYKVFAQGLPANIVIPLAEITVVITEAVLLYVFNRKELSLKHAMAMSVLMNIASLVLGQAIFH